MACLSSCRNWRMNSASVCQRQTLLPTLDIPKASDGVFFKPGPDLQWPWISWSL